MSEVFEGYERQYCELSANLSKKCTSATLVDGEQKKQKLSEVKAGLDEAESLVRKMDLEARSLQPNVKAVLLAKLREYKSDLNNLKSEVKRIASTNLNQAARDGLLESGMADASTVSADQKGRLLMSTERLNKTSDRVRESRKTMLETEELGVSILHDLHQQRQSLLHANNTIYLETEIKQTTMSYYPKGHHDGDEVDDFNEYDPTPYGGGYDIHLTYGRSLPPSEETCYTISSSSSGAFDYDRPQYASHAQPSAYGDDALDNEYKSYARPKPRPASSYGGAGGGGYEKPQANYGFQPGMIRPGGGGGGGYGGGGSEFGGSGGYGRKPEYENPTSEYGSGGYGRKSEYENPSSEYGSGYGRKSEYEQPSSEYGSGYGRKSEYEQPSSEHGSGYGQNSGYEQPGYGSGYGRKSEHEHSGSEYGSGYGHKTESEEYGSGYGRKPSSEYGSGGYGGRSERTEFEAPSYQRQSEGYGGSSYGRSEEGEYRKPKPSYERRASDDDDDNRRSYGHKKHGDDNSDDDDDEKKKHHHKHHHHRKHYDD